MAKHEARIVTRPHFIPKSLQENDYQETQTLSLPRIFYSENWQRSSSDCQLKLKLNPEPNDPTRDSFVGK